MHEIEIEFKNLLTEEEYKKLYAAFNLANKEQIINKNFYEIFDIMY